MITCRELISFLADYLEGNLAPTERVAFEEHLGVCPDCVNYVESYKTTHKAIPLAYADENDPAPSEVPEELIQAILEARPKRE
ncbi:MAG: anti-sigma factor [Phycisphaera sp.]|nr:anti-sigma factor [Phycisphaera sp.]